MWNAMFDLDLRSAEKVIRAVVIYLFLVIALRLVGKRELTSSTPSTSWCCSRSRTPSRTA